MLTLLLALSQPAAGQALLQPAAPVSAPVVPLISVPPNAVPLPPPLVERHSGVDGRRVPTMVYTLAPGTELPVARPLTIAQRRWIGAKIATLLPSHRNPTFLCRLTSEGVIGATSGCWLERLGTPATPDVHALRAQLGNLLRPPVDAGPAPASANDAMPRLVRFTLRHDPADWPSPWVPSGQPSLSGPPSNPLYAMMQRRWANRFPDAALRVDASALIIADCGVEADRSVSCRTVSISPPANEPYFRGVIEQEIPSGLAPATLSDGRATPGLEFRVPIRFMIGS